MASAMPNLEAMLQTTEGSSFYAKIDMCHAYWQLPLDKESQEYVSIQTPLGVHTPTRKLQGGTDAGNNFQASTSEVFCALRANLLQLIDDFVLHARSEDQLLALLGQYFSKCEEVVLKVHAENCDLFAREVKFCGRIIDGEGTRFDPSRLETLQQMKRPTRAGDLL
jgi:Reverse transcriptase (RNA-dependent DNA polymerase)